MEPDHENLRQQLGKYYVYYYAELRQLLSAQPAYRSDPKAFPYHLRDHPRRLAMAECADGYIVIHFAAREGQRGIAAPESFELLEQRDKTVREVSRKNLPQRNDFFFSDALIKQDSRTGEYVQAVEDGREKMDFIGLSQIPIMTADRARADAEKELQDFFNDPDSPFFGSR